MVDPIATADHVERVLIDTDLGAVDIQPFLDDAAFENAQANDIDAMADDVRRYLEKKLAALYIVTYAERDAASEGGETFNIEYDTSRVEQLERDIDRHDPSGELVSDDSPDFAFEAY